ncbi:nucleotidyltransferase [Clostridium sp. MCC353]|uniref:nucleotidyltransferase n=1 Tax=Clostridium sp. MCC353 TaxID=2592646 RepID=UPI001C02F951|nr:nucleotidyltransferase [Clostridium sp. MCC353]MBT9776581.1 nucleotidyltransferase [Clostridium sp. MCC353]
MKVVGLIAEYNPFHNGHLYHIQKARELTGAEYVIVIMSGDFVQRGAPAVYDKYTRSLMALKSGADLVLEMPSVFATSSAEDFASCGVALLDQLGIVDSICFGSECGEVQPLFKIAAVLAEEHGDYQELLKDYIRSGLTYPDARAKALSSWLSLSPLESSLLLSPNNILGIEYIKALLRRKSGITPVTVKRNGHGYHDLSLSGEFASATAIRKLLASPDGLISIASQVPEQVLEAILQGMPVFPDDLTSILNYTLLTLIRDGGDLTEYLDISEELAGRIRNLFLQFKSFTERTEDLKTKQYTYSRISRCLLHLILGSRQADAAAYREKGYCGYARVLGFKKESADLLTGIKKHSSLPLITKPAAAGSYIDAVFLPMFSQDLYASHVYNSIVYTKYGITVKNEYTRPFVMI